MSEPQTALWGPVSFGGSFVKILLLALAYALAGKLGLLLAIPPGYATAVFPASGIALSGILLFGSRVWPGILLGSFSMNLWTSLSSSSDSPLFGSVLTCFGIAAGAAIQGLAGGTLIRRWVGFPNALVRESDIIKFLVLGGPVGCLVSASIGVSFLTLAGVVDSRNYFLSWWTWWVGDTIGVLIFTPLILILASPPSAFTRDRKLSLALPLCGSFALVVLIYVLTSQREQARLRLEFDRQVDNLFQQITMNFEGYLEVLHSVQNLFSSSPEVTRKQFHDFATAALSRHPGLQAISWNPVVLGAERDQVEEAARREGWDEFQITEYDDRKELIRASQRPGYVCVLYIEPIAGNERALGYDVSSDTVRRNALIEARDSGKPTATRPITLVQDQRRQPGFLLFLFDTQGSRYRGENPWGNLRGFVVGVFKVRRILEAAVGAPDHRDIEIWMTDATDPGSEQVLYPASAAEPGKRGPAPAGMRRQHMASRLDFERIVGLQMAGRQWRLRFTPTPKHLVATRSLQPWLVLSGGLLFTGILGAFLLVVTGRTVQIENEVAQRTIELRQQKAGLEKEIAARKRAQAEVQVLNETLEQRVSARTAQLQSLNQKYHSIFENAIEGIFQTTPEGRFLAVNPAMARLLGYRTPEELIRERTNIVSQGYVQPELRNAFKRLLDEHGVVRDFQYAVYTKDGRTIWVSENARAVRDAQGKLLYYEGSMQDVTERKRTEQRLAAQHALAAVLAEGTSLAGVARGLLQVLCQTFEWDLGALWKLDPVAQALRCIEIWQAPSREFREWIAVSREIACAPGIDYPGHVWMMGQSTWIADIASGADSPRKAIAARVGLRTVVALPIRLRDEVFSVIELYSAHIRTAESELSALFEELGGQIGQFIERKQLEEKLLQAQKMECVGQLAAGVAHDFNNLLVVLQGYPQVLLARKSLDPDTADSLREMMVAAEQAAKLTRQLLVFSRKQVLHFTVLSLNDLVGNLAKMLRRVLGEDIILESHLGADPSWINADAGMVEQVLINLAVNGRDAMPGGGKLVIGTDQLVLDAKSKPNHPEARAGEFVCLRVADTGHGMPPAVMRRMFEPFFTTKEVGKGTGLGLATVFGIVKQHDGWIELASQVGVGTTFEVYFPRATPTAALEAQKLQEIKARGGSETVLLVEDDPTVRRLAAKVLEGHGYRVLEARSGVEALSIWDEHRNVIQLLLTDMVMPDSVTGRELAERLQKQKPGLKVIYTSGYPQKAADAGFMLQEGVNFLSKPYGTRQLAHAVRERLDRD